jgi:hypothetical protein
MIQMGPSIVSVQPRALGLRSAQGEEGERKKGIARERFGKDFPSRPRTSSGERNRP